jgi:radical SAM protein with 4Fe4S-binding SPASM domain
MRFYIDKTNKFIEAFNESTGFYIRTNVIKEYMWLALKNLDVNKNEDKAILYTLLSNKECIKEIETEQDSFMREMPNLLDVGIMGKCQSKHICPVGCYQGSKQGENMTLDNFKRIIDQSKDYVFSMALGGNGNPNQHEDFKDIVKYAYENKVIPNYTTSGINLTDEQIQITKNYCGAVAVSEYSQAFTYQALSRFLEAGVKTNIHYVLGNDSIDRAIHNLKNNLFHKGINAIIFLLYKPVGCVKSNNVLQYNDPKVAEFFNLIDKTKFDYKIGLDACSIPAVMNFCSNISRESATACDGASYSAYITPNMKMLPCSFDNQDLNYAVDLNQYTLQEAWNSEQFERFRNYHRNSCNGCVDKQHCYNGCPIRPEINLCQRKERC